jgi:hypothetical protein
LGSLFHRQELIHLVRCFLPHLIKKMAVDIHRQLNRGVPQQLLDRLRMDTLRDQLGRRAMAQIVEPDPAQLRLIGEFLKEPVHAALFERSADI